jgi:hypothetical protein
MRSPAPEPPSPPASIAAEKGHTAREATATRPERICPICGAGLQELKCKLICPRRECGYYMSCSDFY